MRNKEDVGSGHRNCNVIWAQWHSCVVFESGQSPYIASEWGGGRKGEEMPLTRFWSLRNDLHGLPDSGCCRSSLLLLLPLLRFWWSFPGYWSYLAQCLSHLFGASKPSSKQTLSSSSLARLVLVFLTYNSCSSSLLFARLPLGSEQSSFSSDPLLSHTTL
jgi:hypothetical protein